LKVSNALGAADAVDGCVYGVLRTEEAVERVEGSNTDHRPGAYARLPRTETIILICCAVSVGGRRVWGLEISPALYTTERRRGVTRQLRAKKECLACGARIDKDLARTLDLGTVRD
jgi:hypothetical protein